MALVRGNWPAYDRALVQRGDVTLWLTPEAIATWEAVGVGKRGGPLQYSEVAIETALTLRLIFHLCVSNSQFSRCIQDGGHVAWRLTSGLRCLAHEGPPAHPASLARHDRDTVWPRWRASGDRGESSAQAVTDRLAPSSPAGATPNSE